MCFFTPAGFQYVLLGNIQSDPLERRFGVYRQMSGANYYVSTRQLFESERKLRGGNLVQYKGVLFLKIALLSTKYLAMIERLNVLLADLSLGELSTLSSSECSSSSKSEATKKLADKIVETCEQIESVGGLQLPDFADQNIIYYIAGYCSLLLLQVQYSRCYKFINEEFKCG